MGAENRLTPEQIAALEPGDTVTIESAQDLRRPKRAPGTVVRVVGPHIFVKVRSTHGATFQERYGRRDGIRVGGLGRAELVSSDVAGLAGTSEEQRRTQRIQGLYRTWNRNRGDVEVLQQLHAAIGDYLTASAEEPAPSR